MDDWTLPALFLGGVSLYLILYWLFGFTCPQCGTRRGLERTKKRRGDDPWMEAEYLCRQCGHTEWKSYGRRFRLLG